jgi:hypothetical protein
MNNRNAYFLEIQRTSKSQGNKNKIKGLRLMLLFSDLKRMLMLLLLESSGYQYQDGIKHPLQHFSVPFLGVTQMLLHILQGVKVSMYAKRGLKLLCH